MGAYTFKYVRGRIPKHTTDAIPNFEGAADYDGDLWLAASDYIDALEAEVQKQVKGSHVVFDRELVDWLKHRPKTLYCDGGWETSKPTTEEKRHAEH